MKKICFLIILTLIFISAIPTALASTDVTVDKSSALPGETVMISGTADANDSIVIKIADEAGNIVYFNGAKADESGKYSVAFVVPSGMAAGALTVTAGSGSDVATTTIQVTSPPVVPTTTPTVTPTPTTTPTPTPTPGTTQTPRPTPTPAPTSAPASTPTSTPSPAATPEESVSPSASPDAEPTPAPMPSETSPISTPGQGMTIQPAKVEADEETGTVTVRIYISDLPQGTYALKTSGGEIIYVEDAENGMVSITVSKDDIRQDGTIELTTLDGSMAPTGTVSVQVRDISGDSGIFRIILWIAGALVLLGAAVATTIVIKKRR